jgi:ATP-dependent DNA helicase DinG
MAVKEEGAQSPNHNLKQDALMHCEQWFGTEGALSMKLDGYQPRQAQIHMAAHILQAIYEKKDVICEAGTGVGKTLAYLLPCLDSGKKIILATATKALQKQLYEKDVPLAAEVFGGGIKSAILKGKENYLSKTRLQRTWGEAHLLSKEEYKHLQNIQKWADTTTLGDRADCGNVPENSPVWKLVCTHQKDPLDSDDFYIKARTKAKGADLLIINQHLLCAELTLNHKIKSSSLLTDFNYAIIDEAHQFRDIATHSFGQKIPRVRITEAFEQSFQAITEDALAHKDELRPLIQNLNLHLEKITRFFMGFQAGRYSWQSFYQHTDINWLAPFIKDLKEIIDAFKPFKGEALIQARMELTEQWNFLSTMLKLSEHRETDSEDKEISNNICWLELFDDGRFTLYVTPIQVDEVFNEFKSSTELNWIYTSATLTVANDFSHFRQVLGITENTPSYTLPSPFDFHKQVAWYKPTNIMPTNHKEHIDSFIKAILPICKLCEGRGFLLFCSHYALNQAAQILRQNNEFELFIQGSKSHHKLLKEFIETPNSILLGTRSFWEGVDVRGQNLSFVAIDKLPFASPGEPLNQAREEWYKQRKRDSFKEQFLPQAVIALKQGFGRLIRDTKDYGILIIGDNRIHQKSYGKKFIESLPDYQTINQFEHLEDFWHNHNKKPTT